MVLNEPIFDNCLIKKSKNVITPFEKERKDTQEIKTIKETNNLEPNININAKTNDIHLDELEAFDPFIETNPLEEETMENSKKEEQQQQQEEQQQQQQQKQQEQDEKQKKELETVMDPFDEKNDDLKEFNISFEPTMEPITLKKPNEVYYNLYKQARKKAKEAKKSAIIAYLEAKNIKKTYMLENLDDSDDDFDDTELEENEIDDF
jgi:predicted RNase H-like nuclease (RuvC/YqgF family)